MQYRPVHVTRFSLNKVQALTASDDTTVRCWDIPTETQLMKFVDHEVKKSAFIYFAFLTSIIPQ